MQVWLTDDAKGLVQFINASEYYYVNYFIASVIYVLLSNWAFEATIVLNDYLIPHNATFHKVARRVGIIFAAWTAIYIVVLLVRL